MELGDIVRIVRQPTDLSQQLVGSVCIVNQVIHGYGCERVGVMKLDLDGRRRGGVCIPISCLEPETSDEWVEAKKRHDRRVTAILAGAKDYSELVAAKESELAKEYGITVDALRDIVTEMGKL